MADQTDEVCYMLEDNNEAFILINKVWHNINLETGEVSEEITLH